MSLRHAGFLLSRQWTSYIGGSMQMDMTFMTIATFDGSMIRIYSEPTMKLYMEHKGSARFETVRPQDQYFQVKDLDIDEEDLDPNQGEGNDLGADENDSEPHCFLPLISQYGPFMDFGEILPVNEDFQSQAPTKDMIDPSVAYTSHPLSSSDEPPTRLLIKDPPTFNLDLPMDGHSVNCTSFFSEGGLSTLLGWFYA